MSALDRAVAFTHVDGVPETVYRHLDLDVAVVLEELLQVERVVAKAGHGLGAADLECGFQLARRAHEAHALAAAAGRRLDQDRIANPRRLFERVGLVAQHARAGDRGQAVGGEDATRGLLRCEALKHFGRGTDECQAVGPDDLGEALVLRKETVAGVDGVTAGDDRGGDDCGRGEVASLGVGRPDADRFVGQLSGQAFAIGLAVGDDGADAESPAGAQDPQRYLAAVGNQDLAEHQAFPATATASGPAGATPAGATPAGASPAGASPAGASPAGASLGGTSLIGACSGGSMRTSSCPYSTASPASARLEPMIPSTGDTTSCWTPRTSTVPILSPARTRIPTARSRRGLYMPTAGDMATTLPCSASLGSRARRSRSSGRPWPTALARAAASAVAALFGSGAVAGLRSRAFPPPWRTSISPRPPDASLAMRAGRSSSARRAMASWSRWNRGVLAGSDGPGLAGPCGAGID